MNRTILTLFLFVICRVLVCAHTTNDSIYTYLNKVIDEKERYSQHKEQRLNNLKDLLKGNDLPQEQEYEIRKKLCYEYEKYMLDSAIYYVKQNVETANRSNKKDFINESNMQLALFYSAAGMYVESIKILDKIDKNSLPPKLLPLYYEVYSEYYGHYAQSNNYHYYYKENENYRDSLLSVLDTSSMKYKVNNAQKILFQGKVGEAESLLLKLLDETTDEIPERAIIAYLLGLVYDKKGDVDLQKKYFSISTITDIKNATKDNASQQTLALVFFEGGDVDMAYRFMKSALDDANFCNVRFRAIESSTLFTYINNAYLVKETKQKDELKVYLLLISVLSIFLIIAVFNIYRQMKRLSKIRKELYRTNVKLKDLNADLNNNNSILQDTNVQLSESDRIKEEYIAHFFDLCSTYIGKMEDYRKQLYKKVSTNQMDQLVKELKSTTFVENELQELYHNFDSIFLNLYPTFIDEFNALLVTDEQVVPKQGELLNTELRVFALIRLGITDSTQIAGFLRYSLSTIYNYRTKTRNKAASSRDEFEMRVMKIGIINK